MLKHTRVLKSGDEVFAQDDRIFLGEGLFETIRVAHSKPCFARLHWQRLSQSAKLLGISFELSFEQWYACLLQQIAQDNVYHGGIKAILSGGVAPRGLTQQGIVSNLVIQSFNYSKITQPQQLLSAAWLRDAANPIYQIKSINYLEAITARRKALSAGKDDVLFFNTHGHATETSCANIFVIANNQLLTPAQTDGVLPGITRSRLLFLCAEHGISCQQQSLSRADLKQADAVFTTNSLQGIRAVSCWDEVTYSINHPLLSQLSTLLAADE